MSDAPVAVSKIKLPAYVLPLLPILSGVLFAYSLPPYQTGWLGWFALVPLLWIAARLPRTLWAAGAGLATGLVAGILRIGWDGFAKSEGFSRNYALAPFIWIAFVLIVTASFAQWSRHHKWLGHGIGWAFAVACAGTVAEWLTGFTPLPVSIALGQSTNLTLIQLCSVTGIWGIAFLLYLVNAALTDVLLPRQNRWKGTRRSSAPLGVIFLFAFLHLPCLFIRARWQAQESNYTSSYEERQTAERTGNAPRLSEVIRDYPHLEAAAVQDFGGPETATGDPDTQKLFAADNSATSLPDATELMRQAAAQGTKLIIGTEHSFGAGFQPDDATGELRMLARTTNTHLVIGHEMGDKATPGANPFNCATLIGPGGVVGTHHKIYLFLGERQSMQAGDKATVVDAPWGKTGMLICFDSCYTGPTRDAVREGAKVIALPNYDPPTPHGILHHLHAAIMPFRAVENNVAYVRADPNGLSQIVQPWGENVKTHYGPSKGTSLAPMYRNQIVRGNVRLGDGRGTFFTRWGDWLPITSLVLLCATLIAEPLTRRRNRKPAIAQSSGDDQIAPALQLNCRSVRFYLAFRDAMSMTKR